MDQNNAGIVRSTGDGLILLRGMFTSLSKAEKKVASYILDNPQEIIYIPITELAERSGVSEATIVRLCRTMGLRGYQELKINLGQTLVETNKNIHEDLNDEDDEITITQKVLRGHIKGLEDTLKILDSETLKKAIDAVANARKIEFYGLGGSGAIAIDAQHKFLKTGIPCVAYADAHMQAMSASILGKGDVVIGISHSGSTKDIVDSLEIANAVGATTICITNKIKSPVAKAAQINLFVSSQEIIYRSEPMTSRIAQLAILDAIYVGVAQRRKEQVIHTLKRMRKSLVNKRY